MNYPSVTERAPSIPSRRARSNDGPALACVALAVGAYGLQPYSDSLALGAFGLATFAFGALVFWTHGVNRITAAGLFGLGTSVFVGYSACWWATRAEPSDQPLLYGASLSFWPLVIMWFVFWRSSRSEGPVTSPSHNLDPVGGLAATAGLLVSAVAIAGLHFGVKVGQTFLNEVAFAGISILLVGLFATASPNLKPVRKLIIGGAAVAIYGTTVFTGYGRLILVSLAFVPLIWVAERRRDRSLKLAVLIGIGPALALFVRMREAFGEAEYGQELNGLASVTAPLRDFSRLVNMHLAGTLDGGGIDTIARAFTFFIPRSIWPEKPIGFGAELTLLFEPSLASVGHSYAALAAGDWLFAWGFAGVALMTVVVGLAIRLIDRLAVRTQPRAMESSRGLLLYLAVILLVVDIPNFTWGGIGGYAGRTISREMVVLLLAVLLSPASGKSAKDRPHNQGAAP